VEETLSEELDLTFYRRVHADLRRFGDDRLIRHFNTHGRTEGRIASPAAHRAGFLAMIPKDRPILELGPFFAPTMTGESVRYFDVLDQEQLRSRARYMGLPDERSPHIDFVSPTGDLSIVTDKFDTVSSHCVEHQADLGKHLIDVASILNMGGRYYLLIPDKRYCFDHFLGESTITDVLRHITITVYSTRLRTYLNIICWPLITNPPVIGQGIMAILLRNNTEIAPGKPFQKWSKDGVTILTSTHGNLPLVAFVQSLRDWQILVFVVCRSSASTIQYEIAMNLRLSCGTSNSSGIHPSTTLSWSQSDKRTVL
jgi:hypothetical protein